MYTYLSVDMSINRYYIWFFKPVGVGAGGDVLLVVAVLVVIPAPLSSTVSISRYLILLFNRLCRATIERIKLYIYNVYIIYIYSFLFLYNNNIYIIIIYKIKYDSI